MRGKRKIRGMRNVECGRRNVKDARKEIDRDRDRDRQRQRREMIWKRVLL
jgi:hypothetical protein